MKIKHRKFLIPLIVAVLLFAAGFAYLSDYYRADNDALAAFAADSAVHPQKLSDGVVAFIPENALYGLVFYPGGKVEYTAYEPLMQACAERGILCVLLEMPFNLAVFDVNAAEGIQGFFPEIENWYIGGHSLGGSMAAAYLADNTAAYDGLILLGSYSTADLSQSGMDALSVYGSEDGVLNMEKYKDNIPNLPEEYTEIIIQGGNHAGFGVYGEQEGDGEASISNEEQICITADTIAEFMK